MKVCAVMVESRPMSNIRDIISNHLDFLPETWDFRLVNEIPIYSGHDYNNLLTSFSFWQMFERYDKVFLFQHDSGILQGGFDEFLKYDYVGAPWKDGAPWATNDRRGGNGGISIRGVKATIECLKTYFYNSSTWNEDVYFSHNMENVAPYEVCALFGVESDFKLGSKTFHAIEKHLDIDQCSKILNQYERN